MRCIIALVALLTVPVLAQDTLETVDIRFMLRGYFYAGSNIQDERALGGFGSSNNLPRAAPRELVEEGQLRLCVLPEEEVPFLEKYRGLRVVLVNGRDEVVSFEASDSRLSIVQEARAADGSWQAVEYLPSSWCGNSYHRVFLAPGECWEFAAPRFQGELETELRFRLPRKDGDLVSEAFAGSVNPEQFTVRREYQPQGLMDPYQD